MNKLDIKHLAPYLPYDLQFYCICPDSGEYEILGISEINLSNEYVEIGATEFDFSDLGRDEVKPILRPISDLTKEIEHNGERFVLYEDFKDAGYDFPIDEDNYYNLPYGIITILLRRHFDVFELIEQGLAININKIKK